MDFLLLAFARFHLANARFGGRGFVLAESEAIRAARLRADRFGAKEQRFGAGFGDPEAELPFPGRDANPLAPFYIEQRHDGLAIRIFFGRIKAPFAIHSVDGVDEFDERRVARLRMSEVRGRGDLGPVVNVRGFLGFAALAFEFIELAADFSDRRRRARTRILRECNDTEERECKDGQSDWRTFHADIMA